MAQICKTFLIFVEEFIKQMDKDQFIALTEKQENGCWYWTGRLDKQEYGQTKHNNKQISAHRLSWILFRGEIPHPMHVCHHCDTPKCVNPDHLFLGTHRDNMQDALKKGRLKFGGTKGMIFAKIKPLPPELLTPKPLGTKANPISYANIAKIKLLNELRKTRFQIDHDAIKKLRLQKSKEL